MAEKKKTRFGSFQSFNFYNAILWGLGFLVLFCGIFFFFLVFFLGGGGVNRIVPISAVQNYLKRQWH